MKKLIITVEYGNASQTTALEFGFLEEATLPDYLERLGQALFLTGAALRSAKVISSDCGIEWFASSDLVEELNGPRLKN